MKKILGVAVIAAVAFGTSFAQAEPALKKHYRTEPRAYQPRPPANPLNDTMGNAALGGNSANSASGSNSANENANGRSGGGFGG
ncbi:MAG: hypothetical protein JWR89_1598 [Tardiphaga sp.]|uniref:hypothetical protein n=1 Tax=Tardiphaga sp. TaxID=1926292 RepID=UPI00261F738D|nr:hypothetical protein [Tardiphaga sp.]MDB5501696.1 hypothetical protein [Tardiphaga sp.]